MESINLGALLFALLLVLWVAYAIPQLAQRRDVMGRARAVERTEVSPTARDLSAAIRSRRPSREVTSPMAEDRLLLRPADPTRRPRFDAAPGERIDHLEEHARHRRLLAVVLVLLVLATAAVVGLAVTGTLAAWSPAIPALSAARPITAPADTSIPPAIMIAAIPSAPTTRMDWSTRMSRKFRTVANPGTQ